MSNPEDLAGNKNQINGLEKLTLLYFPYVDRAAWWVRENFVLRFRKNPPNVYYHRRFKRVPTIDQCHIGDPICKYEANEQFMRDRKVERVILRVLRQRMQECFMYWKGMESRKCGKEVHDYNNSTINYFTKYGDVGVHKDVVDVYMKQKHRLIWERRKRAETDNNSEMEMD